MFSIDRENKNCIHKEACHFGDRICAAWACGQYQESSIDKMKWFLIGFLVGSLGMFSLFVLF